MIKIRPARDQDRDAIYAICLATGDAGNNAWQEGRDPQLLGHLYAGPYLQLAPELALVAEDEFGVCGYILGCLDSEQFYQQMGEFWLPPLQADYAQIGHPGDETLRSRLFSTPLLDERLRAWPGHLHIDLLARTQGAGVGQKLMRAWLDHFAALGGRALHIGVDPRNQRALNWYPKFEFKVLYLDPECVWMGLDLRII